MILRLAPGLSTKVPAKAGRAKPALYSTEALLFAKGVSTENLRVALNRILGNFPEGECLEL